MKPKVKLGAIPRKVRQRARLLIPLVAVVLVLMTAVIGVIYSSFQKIALNSLAQQDAEFARQVDALGRFTESVIQQYGLQVFYDPVVSGLLEETPISKMEQVYDMRTLNAYDRSRNFLDSIYIYNKHTQQIYSTDSRVLSAAADEFEDRSAVHLFSHLDPEERMTPIRRVAFPGDERERRYFSFLFYKTTYMDEPEGSILMLNVSENWYLDQLTRFYGQDDCILADEDGMILTTQQEDLAEYWELFKPDILTDNQAESNYLLKRVHGRDLVCLYSRGETNGWYFMRILPLERCLPGLVSLRDGISLGIGISFLLLLLGIAATMIYLYLPVLKLKKALRTDADTPQDTSSQINRLVQESNDYQDAHILRHILENQALSVPVRLAAPLTLVLLEGGNTESIQSKVRRLAPGSLLDRQHNCDVLLLTGAAAQHSDELCCRLAETFGCQCFCGVPRQTVSELPDCYQTLLELRLQKFWYSGQSVISEREFCCTEHVSDAAKARPREILSALKSRNTEEAEVIWQTLLQELRGSNHVEQLVIFHKLAELLEAALPELKPLVSDEFFRTLPDVATLNAAYCGAFARVSAAYQQQRTEHFHQITEKAMQILRRDYADSTLSLAGIADELGMSSAYLGRIFKEVMQCSLGQYLNQVRMEQAKVLLRESEESVETIAETVGFSNVKYFYVVFKNIYGMTPLQFRKGG